MANRERVLPPGALRVEHADVPAARAVVTDELLIELIGYLVVHGPEYVSRPGMRPAGELHFTWGNGRDGGRELRCVPTPRSLPVWRERGSESAGEERKAA